MFIVFTFDTRVETCRQHIGVISPFCQIYHGSTWYSRYWYIVSSLGYIVHVSRVLGTWFESFGYMVSEVLGYGVHSFSLPCTFVLCTVPTVWMYPCSRTTGFLPWYLKLCAPQGSPSDHKGDFAVAWLPHWKTKVSFVDIISEHRYIRCSEESRANKETSWTQPKESESQSIQHILRHRTSLWGWNWCFEIAIHIQDRSSLCLGFLQCALTVIAG